MNEKEAVDRLKNGDINGLETLVRKYQVRALRAAYVITNETAMAEDIVANAFLKAYDRIHQFDPSRQFGPWFLRIVVNDAVTTVNRRKRLVSIDEPQRGATDGAADWIVSGQLGPEGEAEHAERRDAVGEAVGRLAPNQRAAIVMRYYLGLSESEIAEQIGRTQGTVKQHLHRGRKRLQTLLAGFGSPSER